ncbi:MAG TPA: TetR/AcrR family transcriptional regulator [Opitutaceae bacterium]
MSHERQPSNQELRTRKDLLLAAGRLMKQGRQPGMDDVAREALVSRATAYRYFPSIEALLVEAPIDEAVGSPEDVFASNTSDDPEARIDEAEASMHKAVFQNEAQLRIMLANSLARPPGDATFPKRQNRRTALIEAALAPSRHRFRKEDYEKLCAALAMIFGTESMIVFRDVIRTDEKTARKVKGWAARALVRAALESSESSTQPSRSRKRS